jgi:hypothetical protein
VACPHRFAGVDQQDLGHVGLAQFVLRLGVDREQRFEIGVLVGPEGVGVVATDDHEPATEILHVGLEDVDVGLRQILGAHVHQHDRLVGGQRLQPGE